MTEKRDVNEYVLPGDIKQYDDFQVFEFHGKDARGFDFGVRLTPAEAIPLMNEPVQAVDADRVFMYAGSDPARIDELNTGIEITMGEDAETCTIDAATMTYVPKGIPHGQRVVKTPEKTSWVLMLTLPPRYDPPEKSES
ncbi:MAG: hypothetical protein JW712_01615 [Dehalococcoidales bacterium]|nr:hypothetical protein [Dehalococcoidales bacterium]